MRVETVAIECARELRLLGAVTPVNAREERERLERAFAQGREVAPRWLYSAHDVRSIRERLAAVHIGAKSFDDDLVRQRIDELLLECSMVESIGTRAFGDLSATRFGPRGDVPLQETRRLAEEWTRELPPPPREPAIASDSPDEASLLSRMRIAVRAMGLPFEVVVSPTLSALAATGHRTILVAGGRPTTSSVARRTVLHEVSGHAAPRARAARKPAIFAMGTAGGHDDQEGYALVLEERAGCLDAHRKHELGSRHLAVLAMREGATFVDAARRFGVRVAERVFRGSRGSLPGLGREGVYLEAFVRVQRHLAEHDHEGILASGQIAVDHLAQMRERAVPSSSTARRAVG